MRSALTTKVDKLMADLQQFRAFLVGLDDGATGEHPFAEQPACIEERTSNGSHDRELSEHVGVFSEPIAKDGLAIAERHSGSSISNGSHQECGLQGFYERTSHHSNGVDHEIAEAQLSGQGQLEPGDDLWS